MRKLLLATNNRGKLSEYYQLLGGIRLRLMSLAEEGINYIVEETKETIEENARLKAVTYASSSQLLTLADDSSLEVDALGREPGVRSARYLGEKVSFKERMDYILARLEETPWEKRSARFRCFVAIATPEGSVELFYGECPGFIALESKGSLGFGYDPIFYLPEYGKTMAELPPAMKNQVSHRGQAARKARAVLEHQQEAVHL
jgi:XTP/dITP diphosphohydrolase